MTSNKIKCPTQRWFGDLLRGIIVLLLAATCVTVAEESKPNYEGLIVEKNVEITMRDGVKLKADVFRPDTEEKLPILLTMTAYQKDMPWQPSPDLDSKPGPYQIWEAPNPEEWVPYGYVLIRVDTRGTGQSPGSFNPFSPEEAVDYYDVIEWAAEQAWSNGNVGLSGISYMAINQWKIASLQPPSLKAILPWEGFSDQYRDGIYKGGIMSLPFFQSWYNSVSYSNMLRGWDTADSESFDYNWVYDLMKHDLEGPFWENRRADMGSIEVPLLSAGNWGGYMGAQHFRGNTEGYKLSASENKRLRIHTGCHYCSYYSNEGFEAQLKFYDHWLKGMDNGLDEEPPVKLAIRRSVEDPNDFVWRYENEWPIARTQYEQLYLSANGTLKANNARGAGTAQYIAGTAPLESELEGSTVFVSDPFEEETEVTGEIKLTLNASSTWNDMNIHATLFIIHDDNVEEELTRGRLRASHRKLDPEISTDSRPWLAHDEIQKLIPETIYPLAVEIWPTSMIFEKGERVKLVISSSQRTTATSGRQEPSSINTLHFGGDHQSFLQIPVVPAN